MKRYAISLLSGVFVILLSISVFNWLINPYGIFSSPILDGVNEYKSEIGRYTRLSKAYQVERIKPEAILLASSRGLVVPDGYFSDEELTGYNLSLTSASTYELFRYFQHAHATRPLKRVVLALDEEFTEAVRPNYSEDRLLVNPDGSHNKNKWLKEWQDKFSSLLSIDALRSSMRTIKKQKENPDLLGHKEHSLDRVGGAGGHRQMFRTMESSVFTENRDSIVECDDSISEIKEATVESLAVFERIVEAGYENNIDFYIYFSPIHARLYEAKCMTGKWSVMEKMKREVVRIVESKAIEYGVKSYPVWDFSGYNGITTEEVPEINDRKTIMDGYWEGSHYTERTAELVFDKIFRNSDVDDFGVLLTTENIENHLLDIKNKRSEYVSLHDSDIRELKSLSKSSAAYR